MFIRKKTERQRVHDRGREKVATCTLKTIRLKFFYNTNVRLFFCKMENCEFCKIKGNHMIWYNFMLDE